MTDDAFSDRINDLFRREKWAAARTLIESARKKDPDDHWLITQLGVTLYEQKKYTEALKLFLASLRIVPDCPLTLWNLAGTLDALGKYPTAKDIYVWLLESKKSPDDDPCWENEGWTDALKADAVYRLGVCFQHLGEKQKAEHCYRQYLDLLLAGIDGAYSAEDVTKLIRSLHESGKANGQAGELRKRVKSTLRGAGIGSIIGRRTGPPVMDEKNLLAGLRAAKL